MPERAIADTSALIALEKINLLDVLCKIYSQRGRLLVPIIVLAEALNIAEKGRVEFDFAEMTRGSLK